ncbi:sigma-54-dependent Fis family transcriptional regulator [bacterium]|nr:sigma-54-dependent Fis family transcriptional regulator [bacterium]
MEAKSGTIIFVDDDLQASRTLIRSLERHAASFKCLAAATAEEALQLADKIHPEAMVVDLSLNDKEGPESGLKLLSSLLDLTPITRLLVLTGHGSENYGRRAIKLGAQSFLTKPVEVATLLPLLEDAIRFAKLKQEYQAQSNLSLELKKATGLSSRNKKMQAVLEAVHFAATHSQPVLLIGETGTGKGVIAQAIHRISKRSNKRFVRYQPSTGSADLVSSELFGHKKGAFTGATESRGGIIEEANGGTLFLDEVDALPEATQILLLHTLQEKIYRQIGSNQDLRSDFRLISATNTKHDDLTKPGKLRLDFYHRIAHLIIELPALREHLEDIEHLAVEHLQLLTTRDNLNVHSFSTQAIARLNSYRYPGNVRELLAIVERAAFTAQYKGQRIIQAEDVPIDTRKRLTFKSPQTLRERVQDFEKNLIQEALAEAKGNISQAAKLLGLDRTSLHRILKREE